MRATGRGWVAVATAVANGEGKICLVVADVQAAQACGLAARGCGHPVWKEPVSQDHTLLVADAEVHLLVGVACPRVRTPATAIDVVAAAHHVLAHVRGLIQKAAGVLRAAGPCTAADRLVAVGQQVAPAVAEALEQLLVLLADMVVRGQLRAPGLRRLLRGRRMRWKGCGDSVQPQCAGGLCCGPGRGRAGARAVWGAKERRA
mmetsp:Transcript_41750/g.108132  ORF Transcript_41750/g.108132 Transcript_41750/m.108132 type:complete len:203 (-) Transcript_41750:272-880(-)